MGKHGESEENIEKHGKTGEHVAKHGKAGRIRGKYRNPRKNRENEGKT